MTIEEPPAAPYKTLFGWLGSPAGKAGLILALLLLMQLPLYMVSGLISEREARQNEVLTGFRRSWGPQQTVSGPILAVPYLKAPPGGEPVNLVTPQRGWVQIAPAQMSVTARLEPEMRRRGLFQATVYTASLDFSGTIKIPRIDITGVPPTDILWNEAVLVTAATDLRGQPAGATGELEGHAAAESIQAITGQVCGTASVPAQIVGQPLLGATIPFRTSLVVHGTQSLNLLPYGQQTDVVMSAPWRTPGFTGSLLPLSYGIDHTGFHANWQIAGDAATGGWHLDTVRSPSCGAYATELLGVDLLEAVPTYLMVSRAAKYGTLFLALSFLTYFIFEAVSRVRIHLVQYALLGLSVSLFALLLIALAEPLGFTVGYVFSTAAVMAQASLYTLSVVGSIRLATMFASVLGLLFGFLYVVLCLETFSLLVGAVALFAALSVIMFVTRRLDWSGQSPATLQRTQ